MLNHMGALITCRSWEDMNYFGDFSGERGVGKRRGRCGEEEGEVWGRGGGGVGKRRGRCGKEEGEVWGRGGGGVGKRRGRCS